MKPIRIGLAGYGKIARDQHEPAIEASRDFELVAIADPATRHGTLPSYHTVGAMLRDHQDIEAIALCMPPRHRALAARAAILAGRHVLLEKPPCATVRQAEDLAVLALETGATLYTAWHSQHGAAIGEARRWLEGTHIRSVGVNWKEDVRVWHPGQAWIWQEGGFGVFDPGINALSVLSAILPEGLRLLDAELAVPEDCVTPIAARLRLAGLSGFPVSAAFDFRQVGPQSWDIDVETDRGWLTISNGGNRLFVDGVALPVGEEAEYRAIYARFAALIRAGESEADLAPLRLVEHAFHNGRTISVEPFEERGMKVYTQGSGRSGNLRIHQALARQLGIAILSGEHRPGDAFGGEIEASEARGVSRTAYREAMRILTAKGLLESRPKAGTHVTPRRRWNLLDPDVLEWMFSGTPDERFIRDLFELRGVIEPAAAELAAQRHDVHDLSRMDAGLAGMREHGLATAEGQAADQEFHTALLEATRNEALVSLATSVAAAVRWTTRFKQERHERPRDPLPDHEALREAIASRRPARARKAMEDLLRLALADMPSIEMEDAGT